MLVYQLMSEKHGVENLQKRRLKVSLLNDLNDPFELIGARILSSALRSQMYEWKNHMAGITRLLCFSKKFANPLLWSHYADKHRGICLGFEVPDDYLNEVTYASARLGFDLEQEMKRHGGISKQHAFSLLTTKFQDWQYEEEVRMFVQSHEVEHEGGLQFFPFSETLALRKVLLGPRCTLDPQKLRESLHPQDRQLKYIQPGLHLSLIALSERRITQITTETIALMLNTGRNDLVS